MTFLASRQLSLSWAQSKGVEMKMDQQVNDVMSVPDRIIALLPIGMRSWCRIGSAAHSSSH